MDGRVDRARCEEGEERCDICRDSDAMMEEAEALRQAYQESVRSRPEPTLDSGIDIPSSQSIQSARQSVNPRVSPSASPRVSQSASPEVSQSASPTVSQPSSPPINQPSSPPSSPDLPCLRRITVAEDVDF